jgi:hypothetical protein
VCKLLSADTCLSRDGFAVCRFVPSQLLPADWEEGKREWFARRSVTSMIALFRLECAGLPGPDVSDILSGCLFNLLSRWNPPAASQPYNDYRNQLC